MKKSAIALLTFAVAILTASCQKENISEQVAEYTPMTIYAVANGIDIPATKTSLAFKFDVNWNETDKIYVTDGSNSNTFTLQSGEGTPKGSFQQDGEEKTFTGEVKAYYPSSMVQDDKFIWPAEQKYDKNIQTIPMYCETTLASGGKGAQRMDFTSLGSVLRIAFTTPVAGIKLKSITIKDDETKMSGLFTVENGKAIISETYGTNSITLDLGDDGVDVSNKINYFNIAVPADHYQKFSITFTATDGKQCVMTGGNFEIKHNTVGTLSLTGKEFKAGVPADALPGVFTVADDGQGNVKKVHFSKGNLYYDGSNWGFEEEQYYFRTYDGKDKCDAGGYSWGSGTTSGHWGLFGWSTDKTNYGMSTSKSSGDYSGNFRDWGTAIDSKGTWSTLTGGDNGEWKYLFDHHVNVWGTCNEVMYGRFIAPDGFEGDASALLEAINDWESAQEAGIVFLPACGYRNGASVDQVEQHGYYWSSTPAPDERAYYVSFLSNQANFGYCDYRNIGISVRLVTDASVTPAPTPTTTGTAKATIGGSQVDVNWVQLWAGGPKFADRNVGANSATDVGSTKTFTEATAENFIWGPNWCTPSKDQMDELVKAGTYYCSEKVKCDLVSDVETGNFIGFKFTGLTDGYTGNSVFFPAQNGSSSMCKAGYWSATADGSGSWYMSLNFDWNASGWDSKWTPSMSVMLYLVRPVLNN